ncbi:MAG: DUF721 domain-containing protein [Treponema sp.]|nr:DUF721 domain-containing protein [Treponema sp.]
MRKFGDALAAIFEKNIVEKTQAYSKFFSCWDDLLEKNGVPSASAHSRIKSLEKGLVWIEVDHPGWKQILQTKERKLLHDFRYRFPEMEITGLCVMLCRQGFVPEGPSEQKQGENEAETKAPRENAQEIESAAYEGIKNPALKKALMKLGKKIVERGEG